MERGETAEAGCGMRGWGVEYPGWVLFCSFPLFLLKFFVALVAFICCSQTENRQGEKEEDMPLRPVSGIEP